VEKPTDFKECDSCWLNAKHPDMLCSGCWHNREAIRRLQARVTAQEGHLQKYLNKRPGSVRKLPGAKRT
jgi:predicted amidophosphoribosyltransferase